MKSNPKQLHEDEWYSYKQFNKQHEALAEVAQYGTIVGAKKIWNTDGYANLRSDKRLYTFADGTHVVTGGFFNIVKASTFYYAWRFDERGNAFVGIQHIRQSINSYCFITWEQIT